jgi:hypothetical protein
MTGGICELAGMDCLVLGGLHRHLRSATPPSTTPWTMSTSLWTWRLGEFCSGSLNLSAQRLTEFDGGIVRSISISSSMLQVIRF